MAKKSYLCSCYKNGFAAKERPLKDSNQDMECKV